MLHDDFATQEYLEDEAKRWKHVVELFSDRNGHIRINGEDKTEDYRIWAEKNLKYAKAALAAFYQRVGKPMEKEHMEAKLNRLRERLAFIDGSPPIHTISSPGGVDVSRVDREEVIRQIKVCEDLLKK